jgi:hypothetical protein
MKTLTIKDLARAEELDRGAMAAVRGGTKMSAPSYCLPKMPYPSGDSSIHADQSLQQFQQVANSTANGSAFLDNLHVDNTTEQFGQNNISVYR